MNVQRELKNEPNLGQPEPSGLERIWDFILKDRGLEEIISPPAFSVCNLQEKDN